MSLNEDQQKAVKIIHGFLSSTTENFMVLEGAGGTGKTYLAKHVVATLDKYHKTRALIGMKGKTPLPVFFTATTNKACEALQQALTEPGEITPQVTTIHSFLRLTMAEDPKNPTKSILVERDPAFNIGKALVWIDEASYIDDEMMDYIRAKISKDTKIIFMGDPAQMKMADAMNMPAFNSGFRKAELHKIERYGEETPLHTLGMELRTRILAEDWRIPPCPIDGKHIIWLPRPQFDRTMLQDMQSEDWTYSTSKFLAFRNKRVQQYNKGLNEYISGTRTFQAGDYAVNNHHVSGTKNSGGIGTDRMVFIDALEVAREFETDGHYVYLDGKDSRRFFLPNDHNKILVVQRRLFKALEAAQYHYDSDAEASLQKDIRHVKNTWVDLRPVYAQTIYKAQGSTFRRVYIDLADIGFCLDKELIMRMLYVACSRARMQLFLTGDLY